jgi:multiple sugar transport system permease protein
MQGITEMVVTFTLPLVLAAARHETSIGGTDWGLLQAGMTPCVACISR